MVIKSDTVDTSAGIVYGLMDFMLQQLLGYRLGKEGFSIRELIISAGLTKKEWFSIKDETDCENLCESDKLEIEKYVNNL